MLALIGTVPEQDFPLVEGQAVLDGDRVRVAGHAVPVTRGTPALLAAACRAGEVLGLEPPRVFLTGDVGLGDGSRRLYDHLTRTLPARDFSVLAFHYLQPDVDWHTKVLFAVEEAARRPRLIADAGFMYAAKMSGMAGSYDLFTPDVGELAFLADEEAPHPFYTRGFILHEENKVPDLIARAWNHGNAAACMLVKGRIDYIVEGPEIKGTVDHPVEEAMEAIGGTGDTLTGVVAALMESGLATCRAGLTAALTNRLAGRLTRPTPATQVLEIIDHLPEALVEALQAKQKDRP